MDENAIEYGKKLCAANSDQVNFQRANALKWRPTRSYDLIWSAGLFDYLDDRLFLVMARRLTECLKPAGRLVLGNFSPSNPTRDYMEFGEWFLNYRTKAELMDLAYQLDVQGVEIWVEEEPREINLFLNLKRVPFRDK